MYIGNVEIHSKLYLAPMAGVTDLAFRQICRELGAGMSCTELVSAKALCYQDKKSRSLLKLAPNEKPAAAQIFGSDIPCMAEAAVIAAEVSGADIIDINMGCPAPKIAGPGAGSALLRHLPLAGEIARQKGIPSMSTQAIGGAVGHNPISIIIPCHRVVGSDGSLTGYAGGIDKKRSLLTIERAKGF